MIRRLIPLALAVFLLAGVQTAAQEWRLNANQFTFGLGYFVPRGSAGNVDLKSSMAFNVDYRYFFQSGLTLGSTLSYTSMEADTRLFARPHAPVQVNFPLYSLTGFVGYQFNQASTVQPYLGAGVNLMTTVTDVNKGLFPSTGYGGVYKVTPQGGFTLGAALLAGINFRIKEFWVFTLDVRYLSNDMKMEKWNWVSYGGHPYGWYRSGDYSLKVEPMTYSVSFGFRW